MLRLAEALPVALRHVSRYAELTGSVAAEWWLGARQTIAFGALSLAFAVAALTAASVWALLSAWESPQRHVWAAAIVLSLVVLTVVTGKAATRKPQRGPLHAQLALELQQDRALLDEWRSNSA